MAVFAHRIHVFVLALLLWTGLAAVVWAAPDAPAWRQNLSCDPTAQRHSGLEYCTGAAGQVHVVVVDLQSPDVRLEYVIAEGLNKSGQLAECQDVNVPQYGPVRGGCADRANPAYYPVMTLERSVELAKSRASNAAVVIDSDYGAGTQGNPGQFRGHGPEGLTVVRGDRLDGPANGDTDNNAVNRPWLAVSQNAPLRAELNQLTQDDGRKADWIYTGVGGGPWLIRSGAIQTADITSCKNTPESCYEGAVQTAVGLSQDRRWLFLVIDARQKIGDRKSKLLDMAQFMNDQLAAWDAIKFDGGGSSQLWYSGQFIARGDRRQLSQCLAVVAPPGSGIEDTAPPPTIFPPEPSTGPGERLWEFIKQKAEGLYQQAKEWALKWIDDRKQQLTEWTQRELERQVQDLVRQLCGSALAPVGLAIVLTVRRRRR